MKNAHAIPWRGAWHMVCDELLMKVGFCEGRTVMAGGLPWNTYIWGSLAALSSPSESGVFNHLSVCFVFFLSKIMFQRATFQSWLYRVKFTLPALSSFCTVVRISCVPSIGFEDDLRHE